MNNRALIGLSAAAMSALVATAVGCGEPQQKTYTPAEEPAATVEAPATTEAETTETEAAEPEATEAEKAEETTEAEGDKAEEAAPAEETTEAEAEAEKTDEAEAEKAEKTDEAPAADAAYTDGEYTAEGKGIGGTVPVTVTVKDGKVAEVTVGDNSETQGIGSKAIEQLPDAIVAANGTEGVDAVSGATVTSKAIFTAVDEALAQAQGGAEAAEQSEEAAPAADDTKAEETTEAEGDKAADEEKAEEAAPAAEAGALTDGSYTAEGKGIGGKVPVTVEVKGGVIATVTVGDNSETQGIGSKAIEQLPDAIVAANGTEGVDAVSGATVTSKAIFSAVEDCLEQAKGGAAEQAAPAEDAKADEKAEPAAEEKADEKAEPAAEETKADEKAEETAEPAADEKAGEAAPAAEAGALTDGSYTAEGKGIGGTVPVTVTVKDGKVAEVTVGDNSETQGIGSKAIEQLPDAIVAANGTEGVDAVSGATVTSKAIFSAVEDCLEQAKGGAAEQAAPAEDAKADDKAEEPAAEEKADEKAGDAKADDKAADAKADEAAPAEQAAPAEAGALTDGSYTAEGKGIGGTVPVTVEVKDGKVATVTVGDNSETQGIGSKAIEQLPEAIVAANGTEGVDAVSGATVTSKAIFTAVEDCLEQAKGGAAEQAAPAEDAKADEKAEEPAAEEKADEKAEEPKADEKAEPAADEKAEEAKADSKDEKAADTKDEKAADDTKDAKADDKAAKDDKAADAKADEKADDKKADEKDAKDDKAAEGYADGEYTAEGKGIGGKVPVTVTVKDGKVSDVKVGDNSETQGIGSKAIEQLPAKIVEANGLEGVDAVSGATVTSKAIFTAVEDCLKQAAPAADAKADKADKAEAGALNDGDYTAEGKGIGGKVPVTVTVKDGKIAEVTVGDNSETQGIGSKAIEQLPEAIVAANGTEGVDAVSGATVTSKAIFTAVEDCLEQAK